MLICNSRHNGAITRAPIEMEALPLLDRSSVVWLDLVAPTSAEIALVEESFGVELPNKQESEEIEFSSRYWEEEEGITINTSFLSKVGDKMVSETVSFVLKGQLIVTVRFAELRLFEDFARSMRQNPSLYSNGFQVLSGILSLRIDMDADILEALAKEIVGTGRFRLQNSSESGKLLEFVSLYEESNITIREHLTEKQRVLSSLLRSTKLPSVTRQEFSMMIKDVNSLITTANFNFERLDYLQDLILNYLSVEQNKVIKIFTVMSVIFLPPTLIASIYGMNFRHLPELELSYGYPLALLMIVLSAVLPLYIFRRKGWL
ncbi:magnesium/cobalt transporter CorA [Geobacter sp. DSM 9736]|uniref:magnesium/cobalt transporter CorA n=1 Tax=Geobacter sp. DSM 9736 TaxID=1277350 RepID=UPI000B50D5CA|nr:magnesium/cobalt transporter CorA [Geobacter sp. DSM 9736]SNB44718.1 magnesium transporter [Geobacter sp. DSM 9736]